MKPKVICIVGSGHSGSTILAIALGNDLNIENVGELHKIPGSGWIPDHNRRCACGFPIHECRYWEQVYRRWTEEAGKGNLQAYVALQKRFESSRSSLLRLLYEKNIRTSAFIRYSNMTSDLYRAIHEISGKRVIVDSSKDPVRAYALSMTNQIDLRLIHLIRDVRGVACSQMKTRGQDVEAGMPRERRGRSGSLSALRWISGNLNTEWLLGRIGNGSRRVSYEEFVENPSQVLKNLGELIGEDLTQLSNDLTNGTALTAGHMGAGNRLRMAESIVMRSNGEWQQKLSPRDKTKVWRVAGWWAKRYGYSKFG